MIEMKINELCKIAYDFLKTDELVGIYKIKDDGECLVCFGGNPNEVIYGVRTVSVNKTTGECEWCPIQFEIKRIRELPEIDVPNEFSYK